MKTQEELKKAYDLMDGIETKGSYLLTLKMFKNFPFKDLDDAFCHPEEEDEC